jgi:hypothetical protein
MSEKSRKYYYIAYGLSIESEVEFPELFVNEGDTKLIDIKIIIGKTTEKASIVGFQKPISAYNQNEYWQEIPNIARYYAKNGSEIVIEPLCENWNEIRLFAISNLFYPILFQRNILPISASGVIDRDGDVVLLMASTLVGKSTLLFKLMQLGYKPFTDDSCIIAPFDKNSNEIFALASFPQLRLWKETFPKLGIGNIDGFVQLRPSINKFGYFFHEQFLVNQHKIKAIVVLNETKRIKKVGIQKLNQMEAFLALHECYPRPEWIDDLKKTKQNFALLSGLSSKIPVYSAERPYFENTCSEFANLIIDIVFI